MTVSAWKELENIAGTERTVTHVIKGGDGTFYRVRIDGKSVQIIVEPDRERGESRVSFTRDRGGGKEERSPSYSMNNVLREDWMTAEEAARRRIEVSKRRYRV
jgi:hypothetical protein